jgi:hypothetical protein
MIPCSPSSRAPQLSTAIPIRQLWRTSLGCSRTAVQEGEAIVPESCGRASFNKDGCEAMRSVEEAATRRGAPAAGDCCPSTRTPSNRFGRALARLPRPASPSIWQSFTERWPVTGFATLWASVGGAGAGAARFADLRRTRGLEERLGIGVGIKSGLGGRGRAAACAGTSPPSLESPPQQ